MVADRAARVGSPVRERRFTELAAAPGADRNDLRDELERGRRAHEVPGFSRSMSAAASAQPRLQADPLENLYTERPFWHTLFTRMVA